MSVRGPQNFNLFANPFGVGPTPGYLPQRSGRGARGTGSGQSNPFHQATFSGQPPMDNFQLFTNELNNGNFRVNLNAPPRTPEGTGRRLLTSG